MIRAWYYRTIAHVTDMQVQFLSTATFVLGLLCQPHLCLALLHERVLMQLMELSEMVLKMSQTRSSAMIRTIKILVHCNDVDGYNGCTYSTIINGTKKT